MSETNLSRTGRRTLIAMGVLLIVAAVLGWMK
jgi:hypothetical protein